MKASTSKILALAVLGAASLPWAQSGNYMPTTIGSTATAVTAWQVQGEYVGVTSAGDTLGAWLVARGSNSYFLSMLPGGLVALPGRTTDGNWNRVNKYTGTATWNSTTNAYVVTTTAGYNTTSITGTGTNRVLNGTIGTGGVTFALNRVERRSATLGLKPKPEWGTVTSWFDSLTAATTPTSEFAKWVANNTAPQVRFGGYLYRGVRTAVNHGAGFLHVECMSAFSPTATGQNRGNSGIYLHSKYEAQVLDSFGLNGAANELGGIYNVSAPSVNAALPPMTFQTYDIYFTPRASGANGAAAGAAVMTVYLNGVLVQDSMPVAVTTEAGFSGSQLAAAALYLQDHSNEVVFNNIWFIPAPVSVTTHAQLRQFLPYAQVLAASPTSVRRFDARPRGDFRGWLGEGRFFDLMGRSVQRGGATLTISPVH